MGVITLQTQPRDPSPPADPITKVTSWESCVQTHKPLGDFFFLIRVTLDSMSKTLTIQQRKHRLSAFDFNSSSPYRLQTRPCSLHVPSPTGKTVLEANLPLGGSPLLPHLKAIPLIILFITQGSVKEEFPSSLWKNHFSIFLQLM